MDGNLKINAELLNRYALVSQQRAILLNFVQQVADADFTRIGQSQIIKEQAKQLLTLNNEDNVPHRN